MTLWKHRDFVSFCDWGEKNRVGWRCVGSILVFYSMVRFQTLKGKGKLKVLFLLSRDGTEFLFC